MLIDKEKLKRRRLGTATPQELAATGAIKLQDGGATSLVQRIRARNEAEKKKIARREKRKRRAERRARMKENSDGV